MGPNLEDLTKLEDRLKFLNSEANKALIPSDEGSLLCQEETRIVKKLCVEDVFNVLSDVSDEEIECSDKSKQDEISKEKKNNAKLNISRTITIRLDKDKEISKITHTNQPKIFENLDSRSLIEKAKEIRIEC